MSHPYTSEYVGFRLFDGSSFGGLEPTSWDFDGSASDVMEFAEQNLSEVKSVKQLSDGTFDVLLNDGSEYRVYTRPDCESNREAAK